MKTELYICNGKNMFVPSVVEGVEWSTERKGIPGKLVFECLWETGLSLEEGNPVKFRVDDKDVFCGYVFRKERDKQPKFKVTAYDQLRYFKNKDTYIYQYKKASEVLKMVATDYGLTLGTIEDTLYVITSRVDDNSELFDIVQKPLDITMTNTKKLYVLYDDAGKLMLQNIDNMRVGLMIDAETGENFTYVSTIDEQTYNRVKLIYDDEEDGVRHVYVSQDKATMAKWGTLAYFEKLTTSENAKLKADTLLKLYNTKTKNLRLRDCLGDMRVRAGSTIVVQLDLGDVKLSNYMLVEKCTHRFKDNEHTMDLTLRGGEFIA